MSDLSVIAPTAAVAASAEPAGSRWKPASVAVAAFAGTIALNALHVPGVVVSHWVPLFLLATGCMAAVQWKRAGVRNELRSRAAGKLAEFGGGVYGALAMATWLKLEAADMVGEVMGAGSIGEFIDSLSLGWIIAQAMESVGFMVRAALWPWHWFSPYGTRAVVVAFVGAWALERLLRRLLPAYDELRDEQEHRDKEEAMQPGF
jgi:hypothetical protein